MVGAKDALPIGEVLLKHGDGFGLVASNHVSVGKIVAGVKGSGVIVAKYPFFCCEVPLNDGDGPAGLFALNVGRCEVAARDQGPRAPPWTLLGPALAEALRLSAAQVRDLLGEADQRPVLRIVNGED